MTTNIIRCPRPMKFRRFKKKIPPKISENWFKLNHREIPVTIFGFGGVGRELVKLIMENRDHHKNEYGLTFQIKAVADSRGFIFAGDQDVCLSDGTLTRALEWKE